MGRIAGIPNKITLEVKSKLQDVIDGIVDSIDIDTMIDFRYAEFLSSYNKLK